MGKWVGRQILSLLRRWVEWWDGIYVNFFDKVSFANPQGIITNANNICLIAADYSHEFKLQCKWLKFAPLVCLDWSQLLSIFMVVEFASNQTYRVCVPVQVMSDVLLEEERMRSNLKMVGVFSSYPTSMSFVSVGKAEVGVLPHEFLQIPSPFTWTLCRPVAELVVRRLRFFLWKQV